MGFLIDTDVMIDVSRGTPAPPPALIF